MDENGSRPSMARPLLCGIMMALVVLAIGLAAWTLVGIDRRSQQLARSDDAMVGQCPDDSVVTHGDGHSWSLGTHQPLYTLFQTVTFHHESSGIEWETSRKEI